jgi:hypothetical protein
MIEQTGNFSRKKLSILRRQESRKFSTEYTSCPPPSARGQALRGHGAEKSQPHEIIDNHS